MTRTRMLRWATTLLCAGYIPLILWTSSQAAPLPKDLPSLRVKFAGEIALEDMSIEAGALVDENAAVVVGTKTCAIEDNPDKTDPNGAILDFVKKTHKLFTNGHTARIGSVSVKGTRIATTSNSLDPTLRIWDLKTDKTVTEFKIEEPGKEMVRYGVSHFHKGNRIAIAADDKVIVLDPAKPEERIKYECPTDTVRWVREDLIVSADDSWISGPAEGDQVVIWDVTTKKSAAYSLIPERPKDEDNWSSKGALFGSKGTLYAWRSESRGEVSEKELEANLPAERRGVVQIDLLKKKLIPLKMGQSIYTLACAIDPTETWLATGGNSHKDKPTKDEKTSSELRIYHLPTGTLFHREQLEGLPLNWLAFTPSGKRIVAATHDGGVRWWDIEGK